MKRSTRLARGARLAGEPFGAASPPIYQTATFAQESALEGGPYDYTRSGNPTRDALESELAALEGAAHALAYASGVAALAAAVRAVAADGAAGAGNEVLAGDDLYGGSYRLLERVLGEQGVRVRYVDGADLAAVAAAIRPQTRLVLVESPTNPLLRVCDLAALARLVHRAGARLAVDGTLLGPYLQRPLEHGADLVVHSATKGLGGHADLTAGVVATDDSRLAERLAFARNAEGTALAPFESWLLARGLRTLAVRVDRQETSARRVAEFLAGRPEVRRLRWPGLATHPGHALQRAQATGFGPVLAFETGDLERSRRLVESLELFAIAVSFGGAASSASLPCRMSHASIPEPVRRARSLPEDLVRLSIGLEDADDLVADIERALAAAAAGGAAADPARAVAGAGGAR